MLKQPQSRADSRSRLVVRKLLGMAQLFVTSRKANEDTPAEGDHLSETIADLIRLQAMPAK
jgi:hypothetical protein